MKSLISLVAIIFIVNKTCGAPIQNCANGSPYLLNNLGLNNLVPVGFPNSLNPSFVNSPGFTANYVPNNCANAILEPIISTNTIANAVVPNEVISNVVSNTIASANCVSKNLANIEVTNVQFTPISELMPSLQFGDITVAGDLPIGGTIKVCGCIPVYGMINVDGTVPSAGTAVVADSFCNQLSDVTSKCANQFFR
ncbi:uncharacterized protein LOC120625458 [Pararge aegeria]|uniref:uncharacterized protein LOC120625458 n=1 Tax=Pararge aegeria TaxID=116150 RepID=UPI0019D09CBD|nr:uncharacterized protein LOC120625458 [Pararge aegeria]